MKLRDYQERAVASAIEELSKVRSTLLVMATGCGKTVTVGHLCKHFAEKGRVMFLAHREELIRQAKDKIDRITGESAEIEMAGEWADMQSMYGRAKSRFVISTIQTQVSGRGGEGRMTRFNPEEFSLLVADESHHSTAKTWKRVIGHYQQNANLKLCGLTATPDRSDEQALGQIFDSIAFEFGIEDAIPDGWLVPVLQRSVYVEGLDFSSVRTTAGDLNGADLSAVMEYEANLHGIAHPTFELANGRKTLVFAASVAHAERLSEILNRHQPGCSRWVCGETDKDERRRIIKDFSSKRFTFLVNVGVYTEGFDDPGIEVISVARPTKSRSLFCQQIGRGLRPLDGLVDGIETAEARREAIQFSEKSHCEVLDFVGNAGKHKLCSVADALGGKYEDDVVDKARDLAKEKDGPVDMQELLAEAEKMIAEEEARLRELEMRREANKRNGILAKANYSVETINAFDVLEIRPAREPAWHKGRPASEKQVEMLRRSGVANPEKLSFTHASQMIERIIERRNTNACTYKQARILKKYGYTTGLTFDQAKGIIDQIAANGWRKPEAVKA